MRKRACGLCQTGHYNQFMNALAHLRTINDHRINRSSLVNVNSKYLILSLKCLVLCHPDPHCKDVFLAATWNVVLFYVIG